MKPGMQYCPNCGKYIPRCNASCSCGWWRSKGWGWISGDKKSSEVKP